MDTTWNGYPSKSEVIGRCGGDENKLVERNKILNSAIRFIIIVKQENIDMLVIFMYT